MAEHYKHKVGLGHAPSYQVSGHPFLTGALSTVNDVEEKVEFPRVAKKVTIQNTGGSALKVHFNSHGSGNHVTDNLHFITLPSLGANRDLSRMTFEVKCKEIYLTPAGNTSYEVYAELTGIETKEMYPLTGSGLTE